MIPAFVPCGDKRKCCPLCGQKATLDAPEPIAHPCKSRGLGDTVAKGLAMVGIKPCGGCKERQSALNRILPYE